MSKLTPERRQALKKYKRSAKGREADKRYRKGWRLRNVDKVREQKRASRARHREVLRQRAKDYRTRARQMAIAAYGGRCACCGESDWRFLCIDHVDGDGAAERRAFKTAGGAFFVWLAKAGWPVDRYQVLCFNCNNAKHHFGVCPHQLNRIAGAEV